MPVTQSFGPGVTGPGNPISLDYLPMSWITAAAFGIGGAVSVTFQVTLDNIYDPNSPDYVPVASASWFPVQRPDLTLAPAITALGYVTFPGPWRAIRAQVATNPSGTIISIAQSTAPRA